MKQAFHELFTTVVHQQIELKQWSRETVRCTNISKDSFTTELSCNYKFAWFCFRKIFSQYVYHSFHPALKYTWEISDTSLAFLDIKVSIEGDGLCTGVHYKPTDSHSYLLYSSSHPSRIPFLILSFLNFVVFVVTTVIFH